MDLNWSSFLDEISNDKEMLLEMEKALLFDISKCRREELEWLNKRLEETRELIRVLDQK
jgi:hypothetical protein